MNAYMDNNNSLKRIIKVPNNTEMPAKTFIDWSNYGTKLTAVPVSFFFFLVLRNTAVPVQQLQIGAHKGKAQGVTKTDNEKLGETLFNA